MIDWSKINSIGPTRQMIRRLNGFIDEMVSESRLWNPMSWGDTTPGSG